MWSQSALRLLPTLLLRPGEFFEDRPPEQSLGGAAAVAVLVAFLTTVAVGLMGWFFASSIDATITRTIVEPWPESACAGFESMEGSSVPEQCTIDEPKTEEVDLGGLVWEAFLDRLPLVFLTPLLGWVLTGAALHVTSALFEGEGSFLGTLSVAGWSMVPQVVQLLGGGLLFYLTVGGTDFSSDPEVLRGQLEGLVNLGFGVPGAVLAIAVVVWQAYIWAHGLREARDLDPIDAIWVAAIVGFVVLLLSLLG